MRLSCLPRPLISSLGLVGLVACGSADLSGLQPASVNYCDNFLIYDMCAVDRDADGAVDFVYFADDDSIFMYRPGAEDNFPPEREVHRCAMAMDEDLVETTSRLFFIDEETSFLVRQDIRGAMMLKYMTYMPEVTACNMRADEDDTAEGESAD